MAEYACRIGHRVELAGIVACPYCGDPLSVIVPKRRRWPALAVALLALLAAMASACAPRPTPPAPTPPPSTPRATRAGARELSYQELAGNTESHVGEVIHLRGKVIQMVAQEGGDDILIVYVTQGEGGLWADTAWLNWKGITPVPEESIVLIYAKVLGRRSYTNELGTEITVPELDGVLVTVEKG